MLTCVAPAKINLVLEVLGKRDDGYHEIRSLVQTISLCDVLSFESADKISFECAESSLQTSDNLVVQAAELLRKIIGYQKGAKIKLEKRIPWGAGLGGGRSRSLRGDCSRRGIGLGCIGWRGHEAGRYRCGARRQRGGDLLHRLGAGG